MDDSPPPKRRCRFSLRTLLIAVVAFAILTAVLAPTLMPHHRLNPTTKIDTLANPIPVDKWDANGLHLADGRVIQLPGVSPLPPRSLALQKATADGVEITPEGRVMGLMPVHHWCGNDPVREHLARIDLSYMLLYLGYGDIGDGHKFDLEGMRNPDGETEFFSEWGWRIGDFRNSEAWGKLAAECGL